MADEPLASYKCSIQFVGYEDDDALNRLYNGGGKKGKRKEPKDRKKSALEYEESLEAWEKRCEKIEKDLQSRLEKEKDEIKKQEEAEQKELEDNYDRDRERINRLLEEKNKTLESLKGTLDAIGGIHFIQRIKMQREIEALISEIHSLEGKGIASKEQYVARGEEIKKKYADKMSAAEANIETLRHDMMPRKPRKPYELMTDREKEKYLILEVLEREGIPMTLDEITWKVGSEMSRQKISAFLTQLKQDGYVSRFEVARKAYFCAER